MSKTVTPSFVVFDSGNLTVPGGLPLNGSCQLTVFNDRTWALQFNAHDAGWDNIHYVISAVLVTRSGKPFTFQHQGGTEGTSAGFPFGHPRRDDHFNTGLTMTPIPDTLENIQAGDLTANIDGNDATFQNIEAALGAVLKEAADKAGGALVGAAIALL